MARLTDPVDFTADVLAVYRLTKLVIDDEIFADIRDRFFDRYPPDSTKLGFLASCPWCVSVYLGLMAAVASEFAPRPWRVASRALAASALTGLISEKV